MSETSEYPPGSIIRPGAYAWIEANDRVLLVRYQAPDGRWSLPGGGIEADETPAQAVIREVQEEAGLTIRLVGDPVETIEIVPPGLAFTHKHMTIWRAEIVGGELRQEEAAGGLEDLAWVTLDELHYGLRHVTAAVWRMIDPEFLRVTAERDRLRAALEEISDTATCYPDSADEMRNIAFRAMGGESGE